METRQTKRRRLFFEALEHMPRFETWELLSNGGGIVSFTYYGDAEYRLRGKQEPRKDFRLIPRRKRRAMARSLAKRQFQLGAA